jgi:hypothetical protein
MFLLSLASLLYKMGGAAKAEDEEPPRKALHCGSVPVYIHQQTHGGSGLKAALHPNARFD